MLRLNAFQFDRHLLAGGHVRPEVDVAEGPGADLAPKAVFLAHAQLHRVYWIWLIEAEVDSGDGGPKSYASLNY
jgi:hypothetical protein